MNTEELLDSVCEHEWRLFDQVNNNGGRASCQQDPGFYKKMRACQFAGWDDASLESYAQDLDEAEGDGFNPVAEKYGYMMEHTHPEEFKGIADRLRPVSPEKQLLIAKMVAMQLAWEDGVDKAYPAMRSGGRPLTSDKDTPTMTSFETYLTGELKTYSERTLRLLLDCMLAHDQKGENMALMAARKTAVAYGYKSIEEAEQAAARRNASMMR